MSEKSLPKLSERERKLIENRMLSDAKILHDGGEINENGVLDVPKNVIDVATEMMEEDLRHTYKEEAEIKRNGIKIQVFFMRDVNDKEYGGNFRGQPGYVIKVIQNAEHTKSKEEDVREFRFDFDEDYLFLDEKQNDKWIKEKFNEYKKIAEEVDDLDELQKKRDKIYEDKYDENEKENENLREYQHNIESKSFIDVDEFFKVMDAWVKCFDRSLENRKYYLLVKDVVEAIRQSRDDVRKWIVAKSKELGYYNQWWETKKYSDNWNEFMKFLGLQYNITSYIFRGTQNGPFYLNKAIAGSLEKDK